MVLGVVVGVLAVLGAVAILGVFGALGTFLSLFPPPSSPPPPPHPPPPISPGETTLLPVSFRRLTSAESIAPCNLRQVISTAELQKL